MLLVMSSFRHFTRFERLNARVHRALFGVAALALMSSAALRAGAQAPVPASAPAATAAGPTPAPTGPAPAAAPAAGPIPGAPQGVQPEPGSELPSLPPSPLVEPQADAAPSETDPRALSDFRPQLDPYGFWVQHPSYGLVWVPNREIVGDGFAPYVSSGRWALDADGDWVWVSDYPFGEVVFHYGRWAYVSDSGWVWVPGYRYAPAWVMWRVPTGSYAYVGWAPLPPDYGWFGGVSVSLWYGYPTPWVFCPSAYAFHRHVGHYVVRDRVLVSRIASHSTRYVPAQPRRRAGASTLSGPTPAAARIPASSVPHERVRVVRPPRHDDRRVAPPGQPPSRIQLGSGRPESERRPQQFRPQQFERRERRDQDVERRDAYPGRSERRDVDSARPERRRIDPERARRQFQSDRLRAPRPMPAPIKPKSAPPVRRAK